MLVETYHLPYLYAVECAHLHVHTVAGACLLEYNLTVNFRQHATIQLYLQVECAHAGL